MLSPLTSALFVHQPVYFSRSAYSPLHGPYAGNHQTLGHLRHRNPPALIQLQIHSGHLHHHILIFLPRNRYPPRIPQQVPRRRQVRQSADRRQVRRLTGRPAQVHRLADLTDLDSPEP